jgi:trans-aconitate methyltransferase
MRSTLERAGATPPRTILDFGCGIGTTATFLRTAFPGARIVGVDPSGESIRAARSLGIADAEFHQLEPGSLPLEPSSVDLIYSNGTFHHIDHRQHPEVFRLLRRVSSQSAELFIFENNPFNPLMVREMHRSPLDRDAKMVFPRALAKTISGAGWRVLSSEYYVFFPRALAGLRRFERSMRWIPLGAQYFVRARTGDSPGIQ